MAKMKELLFGAFLFWSVCESGLRKAEECDVHLCQLVGINKILTMAEWDLYSVVANLKGGKSLGSKYLHLLSENLR